MQTYGKRAGGGHEHDLGCGEEKQADASAVKKSARQEDDPSSSVLRHHGESGSCYSSEEPAQASAPVSTTAATLAGSEDSSSPHSMSDCAGRDGRFCSLSPFARARPHWRPRGLSLQRATGRRRAPGGEPGGARARRGPAAGRRRKEREGRVWFAGNFSGRWVNCDKIGGPSCKNAGEHVAASRSEQSRKRGRARRTNQSLRNPICTHAWSVAARAGQMRRFVYSKFACSIY